MTDRREASGSGQAGSDVDQLPSATPPMVVAVPNVSEGRHRPTIDALVDACSGQGVRVADVHSDTDHHRSVLTLIGDPLAMQDALVALAAECLDRIDLRHHKGIHPRIGALDVAPIVAVEPEDLPLARELALAVSERIAYELDLPVFRYGAVSSDMERTRPHHFRTLGLEGIERSMGDGTLVPDAGPARLHPTAGAVLVGVRPPLVALNVWLPTASVNEAKAIAARVRETGGGPIGLRALGLYLHDAGMAQVSMNIEDHRRTPIAAAVEAVRREAERLEVEVGEVELVGLVAAESLQGPSPAALGIRSFSPGKLVDLHLGRRVGPGPSRTWQD
jgi:glutamate formiminotransferase / 5-formyltetrahydrofolate cyclo-ligase